MIKSGLAICLLLSVSLFSCDNNKSNSGSEVTTTTDSSGIDPKTDTTKNPTGGGNTLQSITVSRYRINRSDLADQYNNKDMKLLIVKTHFSDLTTPTTLKVMLYPGKNHKQHGEGQTALTNVNPNGTTSIESTNIIIGNNYIRLKKILKKDNGSDRNFTYLLLKPNTIQVPGHLVYQLTAVTVNKEGALLDEEELGYSNPSPPAPPLES